MKAVAFLGEGKVGVIEAQDPSVPDGRVLVKVTRSAICGSDMGPGKEYFLAPRAKPDVVGHEAVGVVAESRYPELPVGRRVGILVVSGCMTCAPCHRGRFTLCEKPGSVGMTNVQYVAVPVCNLIPLPDDISDEQASLGFGCGIGVAVGGVEKVKFAGGEYVAVVGMGPIGMSVLVVLKRRGASPVAIDLNAERLNTARALGASAVFNPGAPDFGKIRTIQDGGPIQYAILCSASEQAMTMSADLLAKGGVLVLLGAPALGQIKTFPQIVAKELTIKGSWHYGLEHVDEIMATLRDMPDVSRMVTHVFPMDRCQEAYDLFASGRCGKVLLNWE